MRSVRSPLASTVSNHVPPDSGWEDVVFAGRNKAYGAYQLRKTYFYHIGGSVVVVTLLFLLVLIALRPVDIELSSKELSIVHTLAEPLPPPPPRIKKSPRQKKTSALRLNPPLSSIPQSAVADTPKPVESIHPTSPTGSDDSSVKSASPSYADSTDTALTAGITTGEPPAPVNVFSEILYIRAYTRTSIEVFFTGKLDSVLRTKHSDSKYPNPYAHDVRILFRRRGYIHQHVYVSLVQINEQCAINIPKIYQLTESYVVMQDSTRIPIDEKYRDLLADRVKTYIQLYGRWEATKK